MPPSSSSEPDGQAAVELDVVQLPSDPIGPAGSASGSVAGIWKLPAQARASTTPGLIARPVTARLPSAAAGTACPPSFAVVTAPGARFLAVTDPLARSSALTRWR